MLEATAQQRLEEISALIIERDNEAKKVAALDRRIAELAGHGGRDTRKPKSKCVKAQDWRKACGM